MSEVLVRFSFPSSVEKFWQVFNRSLVEFIIPKGSLHKKKSVKFFTIVFSQVFDISREKKHFFSKSASIKVYWKKKNTWFFFTVGGGGQIKAWKFHAFFLMKASLIHNWNKGWRRGHRAVDWRIDDHSAPICNQNPRTYKCSDLIPLARSAVKSLLEIIIQFYPTNIIMSMIVHTIHHDI